MTDRLLIAFCVFMKALPWLAGVAFVAFVGLHIRAQQHQWRAADKAADVAYAKSGQPYWDEDICLHSQKIAKAFHGVITPGCHDAIDGFHARIAFYAVDRGWGAQ